MFEFQSHNPDRSLVRGSREGIKRKLGISYFSTGEMRSFCTGTRIIHRPKSNRKWGCMGLRFEQYKHKEYGVFSLGNLVKTWPRK